VGFYWHRDRLLQKKYHQGMYIEVEAGSTANVNRYKTHHNLFVSIMRDVISIELGA